MAQLEADIAAMGAPQITDEESSEIEEFAKTTDGVNIRAQARLILFGPRRLQGTARTFRRDVRTFCVRNPA
ncbi:hypothetical protein [Streptomyces sp. NPDC017529]|uniref:hypothetical protein n=1 Tax=Streptomyces sp. NPDC017529 TaxID=3365000 RepID=UPI00378D1080